MSKANTQARLTGKRPFLIFQIPRRMSKASLNRLSGIDLAPCNILASGKIRTGEEEERRCETGKKGRRFLNNDGERTPVQREVCLAFEKVAGEARTALPVSLILMATAYVMQRMPLGFQIIGE
ncbi:hypothetical protein WOLCODRAFT_154089 [Wolfiporia cocos MD-104 SS10]|uniref:Uncharacterized protein n=1 Tax=Wolfiporia cocos (strain MD-104) TaxID=742152 RepID=A0A2H3JVN0_WOLCO|nr:hypothetical protein WOLCODRAFT_154089 [Wolfiporia cocos MD-104 SS10]